MPHGLLPMRLSRAQRLAAVFAPPLLVLLFGAAGFWSTRRGRESRLAVAESHQTIEALQRVLGTTVNAETGQRGYLLTGDPLYLAPFDTARASFRQEMDSLHALTRNDPPRGRARVDTLEALISRKFAELGETVALRQAGDTAGAMRVLTSGGGKRTMDEARRIAAALDANELAELDARDRREQRDATVLVALVVLGAAASALVSLLVNGVLQRYGRSQEAFAAELGQANQQLEAHQAELEQQYEQLQEQSTELEQQYEQLSDQSAELESQSSQLQEQAAELNARNEALHGLAGALQLRTEAAEEANRSKARFLAAMSHDLRTPLNAITGYADLLELGIRGPVNEAQTADLRRIRNSGRHLLSLINGILDFARLEAGKVEVSMEPVQAGSLLRDIESSILPQARDKQLAYACDAGPADAWMLADREKAEQVLLNLVGNAIKFTEPGGHVDVSCVVEGEMVAVHVRDTGRGIAADLLGAIFEPFVQVDGGRGAPGERGVGLGLAISRELAAAMGGGLSVRSEPGRGSMFTLRLRRAPAPDDPHPSGG